MDDLISRQAAIRWVKTECNPYGKPSLDYESGVKVIDHLEKMPSVQPKPKTGRWVGVYAYCDHLNAEAKVNGKTERYLPSGMVIGVYCNKCWCRADKKSDFCPRCGADMRGGGND